MQKKFSAKINGNTQACVTLLRFSQSVTIASKKAENFYKITAKNFYSIVKTMFFIA